MPNALTGDFEAILQVHGRVLDRLAAGLHQNEATYPGLPSFPHSVFLRIGDPEPIPFRHRTAISAHPTETAPGIQAAGTTTSTVSVAIADALEGVRGSVRAQVGAPRIELIHGARDRFILEAPIRARYTADPRTTVFPEFIHGLVRAEYFVREIPLPGNSRRLLRIEVVENTVTFDSAGPDKSADATIARQLGRLLKRRFAATDHAGEFRQYAMKSLTGGGESAVVVAIPLTTPEPQGSLATYTQILLNGQDFAVAVSEGYVRSRVQPMLDAMAQSVSRSLPVLGKRYDVSVPPPEMTYAGGSFAGVSAGIVTISVTVFGVVDSDWLPNFRLDVTQLLRIEFDVGAQAFQVTAVGPPSVQPTFSNSLGSVAAPFVGLLSNLLYGKVQAGLAAAGSELGSVTGITARLDKQLKSLDPQAWTRFTSVEFTNDGVVLRGAAWLSPRIGPVIEFNKLGTGDGYSACPTWLPGGRIDEFTWRWAWFYPTKAAPTQLPIGSLSVSHTDRFIIQASATLPGIHPSPGSPLLTGTICLSVHGRQTDAQSGAQILVNTSTMPTAAPACRFFAPQLHPDLPRGHGRLLGILSKGSHRPKTVWPEVAVIDFAGPRTAGASNTLVCFFHQPPGPEDLRQIGQAICDCGRTDAGLLVAAVLSAAAASSDREGGEAVREAIGSIPTFVLVAEDTRGTWSSAFDVEPQARRLSLRLLASGGRTVWGADGEIDSGSLASALRLHLVAGPPPELEPFTPAVQPGDALPRKFVELAPEQRVPIRALQGTPVVLCFVCADSLSSDAQLLRLQRARERYAGQPAEIVAIADRTDPRAAETLKRRLSLGFHVAADPDGWMTDQWGVALWPTTVVIDSRGVVERIEIGAPPSGWDSDAASPSSIGSATKTNSSL